VLAESPLELRRVEAAQDEPHCGVGWSFPQGYPEHRVQAVKMDADEGVDLTIRYRSGQHRQHREQQDRCQRIHPPLTTAGIRNLGEQRHQRALHVGSLRGWLLPIDSDKPPHGNRPFCRHPTKADHMAASVERPWLTID